MPLWQIAFSIFALFGTAFSHYLMSTYIAKKPWDTATMVIHTLSVTAEILAIKIANALIKVNTGAVLVLFMAMGHAFFLYHARSREWLALTGKLMLSNIGMEFICAFLVVFINLTTGVSSRSMQFLTLEDLTNPLILAWNSSLTCICCCLITLWVLAWRGFIARLSSHSLNTRLRSLGIYIRLISMLLTGGLMIGFASISVKLIAESLYFDHVYPLYLFPLTFTMLFLSVCMSYFFQDIRYLKQLRRSETLEHQIAISSSLLTSLRTFRHNMINMLYGFEGAILSGDTQVIRDYYRELTERCALVNNENVVALERIGHHAVSSLLLRFLERAQEESLPVNLYVQSGLRIPRTLPDTELCEVLGVLLDNALEAAVHAQVRHVSVEMRNVDGSTEIIVKNTYTGAVSEAQLTRASLSTKPGHSGHGLDSCRALLERRKKAFLNMQVGVQYVCAQLLILS